MAETTTTSMTQSKTSGDGAAVDQEQDGGAPANNGIWLGFLDEYDEGEEEQSDVEEVKNKRGWKFPNKVGGRPLWVVPTNLPKEEEMRCGYCEADLVLLIQIYAPLEKIPHAFHRALYLFCCKNGSCFKRGSQCLKALRCQVAQKNDHYTEDTDEEDSDDEHVCDPKDEAAAKRRREKVSKRRNLQEQMCDICSFDAPKRCGRCKVPRYCSQKHQVEHWKNGHAEECKKLVQHPPKSSDILLESTKTLIKKRLFKEYEMATAPESEAAAKQSSEDEAERTEAMGKELALFSQENYAKLHSSIISEIPTDDEFQKMKQDKYFVGFVSRTSKEPGQVLRYYSPSSNTINCPDSATPLFVSQRNHPTDADIPNCALCGSKRTFEFQVTPQLLYYLGVDKRIEDSVDSVDWGTLIVYTCPNSCVTPATTSYATEFVWLQPITSEDRL